MAGVAFADLGVGFSGDLCGDHLEVHHVVAGRCLMALGAGFVNSYSDDYWI